MMEALRYEMIDMFHLKAIEVIAKSLRQAVANNKEGREGMALGAVYDTSHGIANAILLPAVMEFNVDTTGEKYREIARAMGVV